MTQAIEKAAITLVDRAREGDQNAMGMLTEITKNRRHNEKARLAFGYGLAYIKKNPARVRAVFGSQSTTSFAGLLKAKNGNRYGRTIVAFVLDMGAGARDSRIASDIIAHIRPVDRDALRRVLSATPPDLRRIFGVSYRDPSSTAKTSQGLTQAQLKCLQLGFIMGTAKRLQDLQKEETPISHFSPRVGWELGE